MEIEGCVELTLKLLPLNQLERKLAMNKKKLIEKALAGKATEEEYKALLWEELDEVDALIHGHTDNLYWTTTILEDEETGKTYALYWGQDDSGFHSFDHAHFYEVEQKEVMVKQWVKVKRENNEYVKKGE